MAIKTFTTGELLTASDTNTYLANSGLVYITGGALSSTAVNFVGCFTSTYTDYRIVVDSLAWNATGDLFYQFLTGTTPYTNADYLAFYPRHQMLLFVYPSAEMIGDSRKTYSWNLEHPIDHGLIMEHGQDIIDHRSSTKNSKTATFSNELSNIISLGFD